MIPTRPLPIPLLLAVALAGALVAACGGSSPKPAAPVPPTACQSVADCPAIACQIASCPSGACAYADAALATTCDDGLGGRLCDGHGSCVECNTDADCQAAANVCTVTTSCIAHTCNPVFASGFAPPEKQTPNDCVKILCDPSAPTGLVLNFAPEDVVTATGNPCTHVECYVASMTPPDPLVAATVEQPYPIGTACPGGVCDPAGVCSTTP